jgi:hypothetical protein
MKHSCRTKLLISEANIGRIKSEETKKKLSDVAKGNKYHLGIKHSVEAKKKMSEAHKDTSGQNNPFYGKTHTEETKRKISETKMKNRLVKMQNSNKDIDNEK